MRRVWVMKGIVVAAAAALSGCYRSKLAPEAEAVRLTFTADQVRGCESKGLVSTKDRQGGLFGQGTAKRNVEINLKNAAKARGANVIFIAKLTNGYWGSSGQGEAFACTAVTP